ncbi:hypothetical protein phytr_10450 [Candidatus Phycorickettsia trachydisci]|uniref:Uncharacterized protein n=1 Tax=Candidatus Phycorickettsia trachydisci TaxID=2115978 RepID=A0A2P1P9M4_9RICK|nr:hypothetical protein [Candidatus Phycorickettsia trachydisci]AVP87973.1 hypothetical protein phytr_10450 [Candidatus Phycorickettsia trachydisci]
MKQEYLPVFEEQIAKTIQDKISVVEKNLEFFPYIGISRLSCAVCHDFLTVPHRGTYGILFPASREHGQKSLCDIFKSTHTPLRITKDFCYQHKKLSHDLDIENSILSLKHDLRLIPIPEYTTSQQHDLNLESKDLPNSSETATEIQISTSDPNINTLGEHTDGM